MMTQLKMDGWRVWGTTVYSQWFWTTVFRGGCRGSQTVSRIFSLHFASAAEHCLSGRRAVASDVVLQLAVPQWLPPTEGWGALEMQLT